MSEMTVAVAKLIAQGHEASRWEVYQLAHWFLSKHGIEAPPYNHTPAPDMRRISGSKGMGRITTRQAVSALKKIGVPASASDLAAFMGVNMWSTTTALQTAVRDGRVSYTGRRPRRYVVSSELPNEDDQLAGLATPYLLNNYTPIPESGCWIWLGTWSRSGYGRIGKGRASAHRLFYFERHGPIPAGMVLCHKCDTPACVNPDHIFLGTYKDNMQDMIRKGRSHHQKKRAALQAANGGEG